MKHAGPVARAMTVTGFVIVAIWIAYPRGVLRGASAEAPSAARLRLFERYIEALRVRARIPGLSAAIVSQQRIIWEKGFGYQDLERRIVARPDTPYRIASLTKTFTSMLLMDCVERGTLDLDSPINRYTDLIPQSSATVRHVLSHTSEGTPATRFSYNGDRYLALTAVVEECTGKSFRSVLTSAILDRLAMRDSVPGQDLEQPTADVAALFDPAALSRYKSVIARLAKPYTLDARGRSVASDYPPKVLNASVGLISTVQDLASYDSAIDRHLLISESAQELAWTPFVTAAGVAQPHALGWFVQRYRATRVVWHYGYWAQFSGLYLKIPEHELTLILLANSGELSSPFPLGAGDVTTSAFARTFLTMFIE